MRDYHRRLGLPADADLRAIRRAYRELARRYQQGADDPGTSRELAALHRAYVVLSDPERRGGEDRVPAWRRVGGREAFADEVDIDFPAVTGLVDRMRATFFGPSLDEAVAAEVRLTPGQATAGAKIPMDVSLRHTCPVCGGRGEVWLDPCGACAGSGAGLLPHQFQLVVPPGVRDGTYLRFDIEPPYAPATQFQVRITVQ
mgnify:CR=1 FL=1